MKADGSSLAAKRHRQLAWILLILLLFLRIPYTIAIIYFLPIEDQMGAAVYEVSTYALTACLVGWERRRLADFHLDGAALFFILMFRPVQTLILGYWQVDSPLAFPRPASWLIWMAAAGLALALWRSGYKPSRLAPRTLGWLALGLLAGLGVSVAENLRVFVSALNAAPSSGTGSLASAGLTLVYHLGFAPINEEPLFRGFLWGALHRLKWSEGRIWLFQALLFTSAHIYFAARYPLMFWVYIPAAALLFGWLAWRSRSVAPAILAHGLINGSAYVPALMLLSVR